MTMMEHPIVPQASTQLSREQILQATSRCLSEFGYDATTIRRIAGLLDCAVGSIYRYFRDKRELLSIVTQQTLGPVAVMVEAGGSFEQSVRLYHQLMTHAPETYRLMFWLAGPGPESATPATAAPRLPEVVQRIVDGWARQSGDGAVARRQWSVLHGYVLQGRDVEETLAAVLELGVATPVAATSALPRRSPASSSP